MPVIHQFAPIVLYGDAVGNQVIAMREWLVARHYDSRVYAPSWDPRFASFCETPDHYPSDPDNTVILHNCIGTPMSDFALTLADRVVPYYHNITPPGFYERYDQNLTQALVQGREQLRDHRNAPYALAGSEYNRLEMIEAGYARVDVLPYFSNTARLSGLLNREKAQPIFETYRDGWMNWLFVGRLAPNKRQDNVIKAFRYYHALINPYSRLLLVGTESTPQFAAECAALVEKLGLASSVVFAGHVPDDVLGAYYEVANVFVSMSEHEGFGAPVIEAMQQGVPVVALNSTGIAMTMGDAGALVKEARPEAVGELVESIRQDKALRQSLLQRQRARVADFSLEAAAAALARAVSVMTH
ncbi:MAG: glycosyltransferase [Thermoflexales bacterium]